METQNIKLLSRSKAAKEMKIGKTRLKKLIDEGFIGCITLGKKLFIPQNEIVKFIEINTQYKTTATNIFSWENNISTTNSTIVTDTMEIFNKMKDGLNNG